MNPSAAPTAQVDGRSPLTAIDPDEARQIAREMVQAPPRSTSCPVDERIKSFLNSYFADIVGDAPLGVPPSFVLPQNHIARELSLPEDGDCFKNEYLESWRVRNGVLNNPRSDRRTTKGTFHVCEGGLPIPGDKKSVPKEAFVSLWRQALIPPKDMLIVPFTAERAEPSYGFISLLLRPMVAPEIQGVSEACSIEVRFFAPGCFVSNLDFVESIFGNAGDPYLSLNDSALDVKHWTGHTGCVLLAPHLTQLTKKSLGLPRYDDATEGQRMDGMCWKEEGELYNDGQAFKLTCRDASGVIVTLIADNYYGYCKKEVKTQLSYAANLHGNLEEEHAGGALAFPRYNLGMRFNASEYRWNDRTLDDLLLEEPGAYHALPDGHAIDAQRSDLVYIPHDAFADLRTSKIRWTIDGHERSIALRPDTTYMTPSGYAVELEKQPTTGNWRLVGTVPRGLFCHKPCTVSGGGKSEISKSLLDYMSYGPILVDDIDKDFELVRQLMKHDYSKRWTESMQPDYAEQPSRPLMSSNRSLGSVIKLLTPSEDYNDDYNKWLATYPDRILQLVFLVKRFVPNDTLDRLSNMPDDEARKTWSETFTVDFINGRSGHELKALGRRLAGSYLRVGLLSSQAWRTFKLRQDFVPSVKIQTEDDITASSVLPMTSLSETYLNNGVHSYKFAQNCEYRLFQRPDDAIFRGLDKQTELDLARSDNFLSNFEPLTSQQAHEIVQGITDFDEFTAPMQQLLQGAADANSGRVVSSAHPRLVDGKPTKNPRYLQIRPDLMQPRARYITSRAMRLANGLSSAAPLPIPVGAVLMGRRNNPPDYDAGIRPLAVYGPIHYQELPELFMDLVCSLTGKSPSTTGAGSEGALTKGPFNAIRTVADLNAALVSYILTGLGGFSTAAGYVGPNHRVDHDISLLIPDIWCRMSVTERDPNYLIKEGFLEPVKDFDHDGELIMASRLGYRITRKFVRQFLGRVFTHPDRVFDASYLRPETQDEAAYVDGVKNITEAHQRVAQRYFDDGSYEEACPPIQAILSIMAKGDHNGLTAHDAEIRDQFTYDALIASDWYQTRLTAKQNVDTALWQRHINTLDAWLIDHPGESQTLINEMHRRRNYATAQLEKTQDPGYITTLVGTIGVEPSLFA